MGYLVEVVLQLLHLHLGTRNSLHGAEKLTDLTLVQKGVFMITKHKNDTEPTLSTIKPKLITQLFELEFRAQNFFEKIKCFYVRLGS